MTEEERVWQLRRLFDWADQHRYEIPGDRTRIEPVGPSVLYGLCYYCTELVYSLCKIDEKLIVKKFWGQLSGISALNFIELENADFNIDDFCNPAKVIFWGTVLDLAYPWKYRHTGTRYTDFCTSIAEGCGLDKEDEDWELGSEWLDEQHEIEEKWRREKQEECRDFLRGTRQIEMTVVDAIFDSLKSCDVTKYPMIRCQLITCLLKQFRDNFISNAVVSGPYILNFGGLWEKDFAKDKGQVSGHIWIDFSNLWNNYELERVGAKCRFRPGDQSVWFEWERPILIGFPMNYGEIEEKLLETWTYDSGRFVLDPSSDSTACWIVKKLLSRTFEGKAREMEELALPLLKLPLYRELVGKFIQVIRNGQGAWKPCHVQWAYIEELNKVIKELELAYQEWQGSGSASENEDTENEPHEKSFKDIVPKERKERTKTWDKVIVEVVDDETIKYKLGNGQWCRKNYTELGFIDNRTKLPNKLWDIFLSLATTKATMKLARPRITPKDIDRIREILRKFFGIRYLPITYDREAKKYCCNFSFYDPRDW